MKGLAKFLVETILDEAAEMDKVVVVYSGRFQPFHKGHYATYENLIRKFGKDSVYIGTSNVTDSKKSPFNFKEKKAIMMQMFGIPSSKIVNVKNPYRPEEILNKYDSDRTGLIVVVGEKDQNRLSGNYFTPYKGKVEQGYLDKGYVYASPAQSNPISGTDVRYWLSAGSEEERKKNFTKAYPKFDSQIFKLITLKLKGLKECINEEIKLNVKIGDTILMGRFKNKKVVVKTIGTDDWGMPTINGKKVATFRIPKKEELKEAASNSGFSGADEPDTSFVADRQKRILNKTKPEGWYKQGGYTQLDKPKADNMRGVGKSKDNETQFRKSYYKINNVEKSTLNPADDPHKVEDWKEVKPKKAVKKPKRFWELPENQKDTIISKEDIKEIVEDFDNLLDEMGLGGGAGVGLSLPGGYINGAPDPKDAKKLKSKLDGDGSEEYEPIDEKVEDGKVICDNCNWQWEMKDGGDAMYLCHKCGHDNHPKLAEEVARYIEPKRVETFLKKYPKVNDLMQKIVDKVKDVNRGYQIFLHYKDDKGQERYFGGKKLVKPKSTSVKGLGRTALNKTGKSLNSKPIYNYEWNGKIDGPIWGELFQYVWNKKYESINEATSSEILKDLDKVKSDLLKKAEVLIAKKKKLYSNIDIESPMSADEKKLDKDIADIFSQINQLVLQKRNLKKESVNESLSSDIKNAKNRLKDPHTITDIQYNQTRRGDKYIQINYKKNYVPGKMYDPEGQFVSIFYKDDKDLALIGKQLKLKLKESVNESLLLEGGAYGHMNHPFDIEMNLTFGDLKQIVTKALNGDLDLAREKTDGQALAISWVNGRLVAARNKSHTKNKGEGAMTIGQVAQQFAGRGALTDAYTFAMNDLSKAISGLSEPQRKKIFKDGACFMNLEVIYPQNANVIPYGQPLLVFHGTFEYNKEGEIIGENQSAASILAGMIKQVNKHVQDTYTIQGPPMQSLPKSESLSKLQGKYISMINRLQKEFNLSDSDGVADYHQAWWTDFVEKGAKKLDIGSKIGLVKRWAFGDKSMRINQIQDDKIRAWADKTDKQDQQKIMKNNIMKFEEIFLGVGADVLEFMESVLTANPSDATKQLRNELGNAIKQIKASGNPQKIDKLKIELQRLNTLGGFDKIVPNEGIVFVYGGNTYKLTGAFAPLNQILGIFKYGR